MTYSVLNRTFNPTITFLLRLYEFMSSSVYYYYYYYYYYVELVTARATTVLHCPLSCMQACISSSCSHVSLVSVYLL